MKCPKCDYLGFETGDRCKNCGYDFSLMEGPRQASASHVSVREPDLPLRDEDPLAGSSSAAWLDHFDRLDPSPAPIDEPVVEAPVVPAAVMTPAPLPEPTPEPVFQPAPTPADAAPVATRAPRPRVMESALPLFNPYDDDAPLVRLPATPRAPLAVRRTPDTPRLRAVPKPSRRSGSSAAAEAEPVLAFPDDVARPEPASSPAPHRRQRSAQLASAPASDPQRRLAAVAVDHAILLAIDVLVVYFTLRLAAMTVGEWRALPAVPLVIFLGLVKASYFCVFTLVGGQTIGKMAARIRVIADDGRPLDPPRAIRRTCVGAISFLTLGLAFLPGVMASDRRALHDRLARTRVITVGS